ncbi:DUF2203 domain-containing protein [Edaphobacter paludis]|uniref:DUF2203 domain-containing protein n=1 Tax=Edaphobacter paludis TaxID=3035702 RepID=A0AAU7DB02_9BACT
MSKTFTLGEAQTMLRVLEALLRKAQGAGLRAGELEMGMQQLSYRIHLSGGMNVNVTAAARRRAERDKAAQETADTLGEIEAIGVQVQDLEEGLLDFPCVKDGKTVMLCWKLGEDSITHWHEPEDGFAGRKPLDAGFGKPEREQLN